MLEIINDSLNDIERKLNILLLEKSRLLREKNRESNIDPYSLPSTDFSKPVIDGYKKSEIKIKDDEYIKKLEDKISRLDKEITYLEDKKKTYYDNLSKMDGIEYRLFSYMMQGIKPTKAIEKVADENYLKGIKPATERGIIPYYKNVKKICGFH